MCVGIPMQVIEQISPGHVLCAHGNDRVEIDTALIGAVEPGMWLMTFLGAAREVMDEESARRTLDALAALEAVMAGQSVDLDAAFADLIGREPQLPAHLREGVS